MPVSTQWTSDGHFYPIQIAQFGLSHYSKHLAGPKPRVQVLDNGESGDTSEWLLPDRKSQLAIKTDEDFIDNSLIEFNTAGNLFLLFSDSRGLGFMVFNATFNNISVISWQSVLLVEETRENYRPVASH